MNCCTRPGLVALLLVIACGDGGASTGSGASSETATGGPTSPDPNSTGSTTSTGSTGGSAGETTGATTTTTMTTTTGATTTTTTSGATSTSSGTSDSSTAGPVGEPLSISLKDVILYSNCQPIVDPDSIIGSWTVVHDNTQGAAESSAELVGATLTLSAGMSPSVHDITVLPTQSGPVPAQDTVEQPQMKQKAGPISGCSHCDQPYRLELVFHTGGIDVPVLHEDSLPCVY